MARTAGIVAEQEGSSVTLHCSSGVGEVDFENLVARVTFERLPRPGAPEAATPATADPPAASVRHRAAPSASHARDEAARSPSSPGAGRGAAVTESAFPAFPYHPDPRATGCVVESEAACRGCGGRRGYIYTGPVYALEELEEALCPWCIADGTAAAKFAAEFTDTSGAPADVPPEVLVQLAQRTPGFSGWQQEHWLYHCGDACALLGHAGRPELEPYGDALDALRGKLAEDRSGRDRVDAYLAALDKDGDPTAYLFRCLQCGRHLAYSDCA